MKYMINRQITAVTIIAALWFDAKGTSFIIYVVIKCTHQQTQSHRSS